MEEREWRLLRVKGLHGQMQHNRGVLADRIKHDRFLALRRYLTHDIDRFRLQAVKMIHVIFTPYFLFKDIIHFNT